MKNKTIIFVMLCFLALNFYAWHRVTVDNDKIIKDIYKNLEFCRTNNG